MPATRVLLIRHGQSIWNAEGRWQGSADPPLSELGEEQARSGARRLGSVGTFDGVGSSALRRAIRTAEHLAAGVDAPMIGQLAGLNERHAGDWEGLTRAEIEQGYPGWLDEQRRPEGYEGDASIVERGIAALRELADRHEGATLAMVAHGGIIGTLERHTNGEPWRRLANLEARWFEIADRVVTPVGERVHLVDPDQETQPPTPRDYA
ncbi:MAG: histidine phosphatase family protein [Actinomycetota bacterium]